MPAVSRSFEVWCYEWEQAYGERRGRGKTSNVILKHSRAPEGCISLVARVVGAARVSDDCFRKVVVRLVKAPVWIGVEGLDVRSGDLLACALASAVARQPVHTCAISRRSGVFGADDPSRAIGTSAPPAPSAPGVPDPVRVPVAIKTLFDKPGMWVTSEGLDNAARKLGERCNS